MIRPAKTFLFGYLKKELAKINFSIGLDAASAGFKNRWMFKTKKYYGLDIDLSALKKGLEKYASSNVFGILCDLREMDLLPEDSVDVLLSSNTIAHLSPEEKIKTVQRFCNLTTASGYLFCQMLINKEANQIFYIFENNFNNVKKIYYGNPLSRAYESIFEKDGYLGSHPIAGTRPFLLLSWLISRLEYLTCRFEKINKQMLVICSDKKDKKNVNRFDLSKMPLIQDRLYNALSK
jgi:hypothetical protein